jgi:hypothetical protein
VRAGFTLGHQDVFKTVTLRADDPLVEVELDIRALPETTALVQTPTILETDTRTDDLDFGAFTHTIDTRPISSDDRTSRRSIFYPTMYGSDDSSGNVGLSLITHGLQGVSGATTRGVMLVRDTTKDKEGVTDLGAHRLHYAYLPHSGNAMDIQASKYAYAFNQPLIPVRKNEQTIKIQLPFDLNGESKELKNLENSSPLPITFSMLSMQNAGCRSLSSGGSNRGDDFELQPQRLCEDSN